MSAKHRIIASELSFANALQIVTFSMILKLPIKALHCGLSYSIHIIFI